MEKIKGILTAIAVLVGFVALGVDWVSLLENIINIPSWCGWVIVGIMAVIGIMLIVYIIKSIINMLED